MADAGLILTVIAMQVPSQSTPTTASAAPIALPSPRFDGRRSLEETLARRRSIRELSPEPLTTSELGQLLWAAQGVTDAEGRRTAPSAGAMYSLEVYAVTADGIFRYEPAGHAIRRMGSVDVRRALGAAAFDQLVLAEAPLTLALTAVLERTRAKYGLRAARYLHFEAGHAMQNVLLQAVALGLGAVAVGAFDDERVSDILALPDGESPLYLVPIGHRR